MAMNKKDASEIAPKFVPDDELLPRDNSGGIDYQGRTAQFGDGGKITGPKASLSADSSGGNNGAMGNQKKVSV